MRIQRSGEAAGMHLQAVGDANLPSVFLHVEGKSTKILFECYVTGLGFYGIAFGNGQHNLIRVLIAMPNADFLGSFVVSLRGLISLVNRAEGYKQSAACGLGILPAFDAGRNKITGTVPVSTFTNKYFEI